MGNSITSQALQPGTLLRSNDFTYQIIDTLGSGSFGITYLAKAKVKIGNVESEVRFAIKEHFMDACYRGDDGSTVIATPMARATVEESRADFLTEARRLQKLCVKSHNIVNVNETFEANGTAYYVMEFLDGGNPCRMPEQQAVKLVMQVADAVEIIHRERVLHLDIKPENIVMKTDDDGEEFPILIDFGIAKHFDKTGNPTSRLSAKGASSGYAPMEQYGEITEFSPKYDIYALGGVLFYLLTGKNPPYAFSLNDKRTDISHFLPPETSEAVRSAIVNAMKLSSSERTPDIEHFKADLERCILEDDVVEIMPETEVPEEAPIAETEVETDIQADVPTVPSGNAAFPRPNEPETVKPKKQVSKESATKAQHITVDVAGTEIVEGEETSIEPPRKKSHRGLLLGILGSVAVVAVVVGVLLLGADDDASNEDNSIVATNHTESRTDIEGDEEFKPLADGKIGDATSQEIPAPAPQPTPAVEEPAQPAEQTAPETPHKKTDDELYAEAKTIADFKALADRGYAKAYAPLASLYLSARKYREADTYARRALSTGANRSQAETVINSLKNFGYYDNGENGGEPVTGASIN